MNLKLYPLIVGDSSSFFNFVYFVTSNSAVDEDVRKLALPLSQSTNYVYHTTSQYRYELPHFYKDLKQFFSIPMYFLIEFFFLKYNFLKILLW